MFKRIKKKDAICICVSLTDFPEPPARYIPRKTEGWRHERKGS
jgi:hypothetical protein